MKIINRLTGQAYTSNTLEENHNEYYDYAPTLLRFYKNDDWDEFTEDDAIEQLKDELDALRVVHESELSLWRSKYEDLRRVVERYRNN